MIKRHPIPAEWTPDQALAVANFLQHILDDIWRAHGVAIGMWLEHQHREHVEPDKEIPF